MLLIVNAAATWFMTGLIWFVQVVHYPLFAGVGRDGFAAYHDAHARRTTWVVGPAMLCEALSAALLVAARPPTVTAGAAWLGLALVAVIWLSTAALQVPQHGVLGAGFAEQSARRLVAGNWIRTAAWSARAVLVASLLARGAEQ